MLEHLGNIGDFVGGIAVIATLLYLAVQVRQNTRLMRASALSNVAAANVSFNQVLGTDAAAARVFQVGLEDFRSLTGEEQRQFINLLRTVFAFHQHVYQQYAAGLIEEEDWIHELNVTAQVLALPHIRSWWEHRKDAFVPEFREAIDSAPAPTPMTLAADVIAEMIEKAPRPKPSQS